MCTWGSVQQQRPRIASLFEQEGRGAGTTLFNCKRGPCSLMPLYLCRSFRFPLNLGPSPAGRCPPPEGDQKNRANHYSCAQAGGSAALPVSGHERAATLKPPGKQTLNLNVNESAAETSEACASRPGAESRGREFMASVTSPLPCSASAARGGKEKTHFNINSALPPWDAIAKLSVGRTLIKGGKTKACCTAGQK